jgi:very-short-patch-repair endonuclease
MEMDASMAASHPAVRNRRICREMDGAMNRDLVAAGWAAEQQGMITTAQLVGAGLDDRTIRRRVAGGWLTRRYLGVYQLGVFAGPFGAEAAALLACGLSAVISHWTAAGLWRLVARGGLIHVSAPSGAGRKREGIRVHELEVTDDEIITRHGIRVTTPARTLLDLASSMPERTLDRLVEEAQVLNLTTRDDLLHTVTKGAGRPGVRKLAAIVGSPGEPAFTRSEAERLLLELVRAAGLPRPHTNARVAGYEVDAHWPLHKLVVEVDGWTYHRTRAAFERDRRRDGRLLVAGYRVLRITWRQLTREPERVTAMLGAILTP